MNKPLSSLALIAVALTLGAAAARADVPPPDACTSPGQPCQNAGPQFDRTGTCVRTTCTRQVPAADGGTMPMSYDCNLCRTPDGGAGGSGGGSSGSSGCAVAPTLGDPGRRLASAALMLSLSLSFFFLGRSRARRRTTRA